MTFAFLCGCFLYSLIEIVSRGYTHWSMTLTGGVCLAFIYYITNETRMNTIVKCLTGAIFITSMEFIVGCIVNLKMHWNVWDYSDMPVNLLGQICIPFSVIWFGMCYIGCRISIKIKKHFILSCGLTNGDSQDA